MYPDPNQQHGVYGAAHGHATTSQAGPVPSAPPLPQSTFAAAPQPAPGPSQPYNPYAYSAQQPNGYNNAGAGAAGPGGFGGQPGGGVYAAAAAGPGYPSTQQQGYAGMQQPQPYNPMQYGGSTFMPGPPQQQQGPGDAQVLMPNLSPMNLMAAGSTFFSGGETWGQQYLQRAQQRMSWLSGGALSYHFSVSNSYVRSKLFMLCAPYLRRWTYCRQPDQGNQQYLPPRLDVNAPDLYLPALSLWTYIIGVLLMRLLQHKYKPDLMYATAWNACFSWVLHAGLLAFLLRAMALPATVPWLDLFAYTGYAYIPACAIIVAGVLAGKWGYYAAWLYLSTCMAVFLVRTLKRAVFQEVRNYGKDLTVTNYLLLTLAVFQFPFLFWMTNVQLPHLTPLLLSRLGGEAATGAAPAVGKGPA